MARTIWREYSHSPARAKDAILGRLSHFPAAVSLSGGGAELMKWVLPLLFPVHPDIVLSLCTDFISGVTTEWEPS